ncbi:DUF6461 domain-containing protein [Streptomyces sp. NPDC102270]|uniref:DUF6461 domain-containing protein n=1 Tax=Streptomyces sp. NPDC102270 TaxID=3366150 RepID=UPI00380DE513
MDAALTTWPVGYGQRRRGGPEPSSGGAGAPHADAVPGVPSRTITLTRSARNSASPQARKPASRRSLDRANSTSCTFSGQQLQPLFADARYGSHPDELLTEMRESGFDLTEREEDGDHDAYDSTLTGASFALAHRLTGIRLTPELFATAEFLCGVAPVPRG